MKNYIMGFVIICALVLSGCSFGKSVEKQLSDTLSKMYNAEEVYRDRQAGLSELEKSEQELFISAMELTQEETKELKEKVSKLEEMLNERLSEVKEEEASMKKAKELTKSLDEAISKVDDIHKKEVEALKNAVANRYELHATFIAEYKKLASIQTDLYEMLTNEETNMPELTSKVDEVNTQNEIVQSAVHIFNESTETVNRLKEDMFTSFKKDK
ncbi:YkyA family protein [Sporosarcina sp. G11-34]|uniref:YkyA family protein n=1 Tax=Sporosarcina sp. G11-34 TaxID=2849605 RepID=UPI0022A9CFF4|nr:YkyA family protein [Sporosarcina sp. G11-34]MCZ2258928.1 YkyA family protein [Sporosarcina sp. G11-34]